MKLEKAIELLQLEDNFPWNKGKTDLSSALKLAIEALKAIKAYLPYDDSFFFSKFKGETEE